MWSRGPFARQWRPGSAGTHPDRQPEPAKGWSARLNRSPPEVVLAIVRTVTEPSGDQLEIAPRTFACDGEFLHIRRFGKDGAQISDSRFIPTLGSWQSKAIKHGGIRVVVWYPPEGGSPRNNDMFDVGSDRAAEVTAWFDQWLRRRD
jgi:hypothetical protein